MNNKKIIYISGPITGVKNYWLAFEKAEEQLSDYIVLSPSRLPMGMSNAQYMRIDLAQIDTADVVYFLKGWENSKGARLEHAYCEYIGKEVLYE